MIDCLEREVQNVSVVLQRTCGGSSDVRDTSTIEEENPEKAVKHGEPCPCNVCLRFHGVTSRKFQEETAQRSGLSNVTEVKHVCYFGGECAR